MNRRNSFGLAIVIVFFVSLGIILAVNRTVSPLYPTVTPIPTQAIIGNTSPAPVIVTMRSLQATQINEKGTTYSVTGSYPQMINSDEATMQAFNSGIEAVIKNSVDSFKQDIASASTIEPQPSPTLPPSEMMVTFKTDEIPNKFISVLFNLSPYISGAAHPNQLYISAVFDVEHKKFLQLNDLFKPTSGYVATLARDCATSLKNQMKNGQYDTDTKSITQGCAAKAENFQTFTLAPGILMLHFSAYAVGPYASGPAHVPVKVADLKNAWAISF